MAMLLILYAFVSNVALAVVPHEPVVIWYGARIGVWATASLATLGTLAASWVDHRLFAGLVSRRAARAGAATAAGVTGRLLALFRRAPFAVITLSGLTPLPFFPFKALAFATKYPLGRYLAAVAAGRFPRYALLAWLGVAFQVPGWLLAAAFLLLLIPSIRGLRWPRPAVN